LIQLIAIGYVISAARGMSGRIIRKHQDPSAVLAQPDI
jgi:hypothetical protein